MENRDPERKDRPLAMASGRRKPRGLSERVGRGHRGEFAVLQPTGACGDSCNPERTDPRVFMRPPTTAGRPRRPQQWPWRSPARKGRCGRCSCGYAFPQDAPLHVRAQPFATDCPIGQSLDLWGKIRRESSVSRHPCPDGLMAHIKRSGCFHWPAENGDGFGYFVHVEDSTIVEISLSTNVVAENSTGV